MTGTIDPNLLIVWMLIAFFGTLGATVAVGGVAILLAMKWAEKRKAQRS